MQTAYIEGLDNETETLALYYCWRFHNYICAAWWAIFTESREWWL